MAVKNRPVIGTVHCEHCDGTRSVHMYESRRHQGKLYTRCPSCPEGSGHRFISKTSRAEQSLLRTKATFKPGFEHLAEEPEPVKTPEPREPSAVADKNEPQKPQTDDPKPQTTPTRKGKGGALVVGVVSVLLIIAGVAKA